jgi:hypothetical protein
MKRSHFSTIVLCLLVFGFTADCAYGQSSNCATPPNGLIAWWSADGTPAAIVGPAGTMQNGAGFAPGKVGQAFSLDGTDQYVATTLDVQPSALPETTWEAWVFPTRVNWGSRQQILSDDSGGYGRSVLIEGGTTNFGVFTGGGVWQPTGVTTGQWQHVAVVFSATNIVFYKNGVQFSFNAAPSSPASSLPLQIGRNPGFGEYFQGLIDEVSIYNRALSAAEIQAIVAADTAGKCKPNSLLSIDLVAGQALISWPISPTGFTLQASPSVAGQWLSEGSVPVVWNGRNVVTNTPSQQSRFYRLAMP